MKLAAILGPVALALSIWSGAALASGPTPGHGPWVACADSSAGDRTCASILGSADLIPGNGIFDCMTPNGNAGVAVLNINSGKVHCDAV